MKGDPLPVTDNIARFCKRQTINPVNGEIEASAFILRSSEESLSVNWLEHLNCASRDDEVAVIRNVLQNKLNIKARDKIAILNVGTVINHVRDNSEDGRVLSILHDPDLLANDPSHSGIFNMREDNELIAEIIREVITETHSAL